MNTTALFSQIQTLLNTLPGTIRSSNLLHLHNDAIHAENFFCKLLNLIFPWDLENSNACVLNQQTFDLANEKKKIFIQITSIKNHQAKYTDFLKSLKNADNNESDSYFHLFYISQEVEQRFLEKKFINSITYEGWDINKLLKAILYAKPSTQDLEPIFTLLYKELIPLKSDETLTSIINNHGRKIIQMNPSYWGDLKGKKSKAELLNYYTNINSSPNFLPYVIADNFYVQPTEDFFIKSALTDDIIPSKLTYHLPEHASNYNCLIKIHANGGSGKTTQLFHLGKKYSEQFHILFFKEISFYHTTLPSFEEDNKPVVIMLDNYANSLNELIPFTQALIDIYYARGYCLVIAERYIQKSKLDKITIEELNENYTEVIDGTIKSDEGFFEALFNEIIIKVDVEKQLSYEQTQSLKVKFTDNANATTAERIVELLISIRYTLSSFLFKFDWEDWEVLCKKVDEFKPYANLYAVVAAFNCYNITPPIDYCLKIIGGKDFLTTYKLFSDVNLNLPIGIIKDHFFELRNPNLSKWYISYRDTNRLLTKKFFADALTNPATASQLYLLRNSYRNRHVLKEDILNPLIPKLSVVRKYFDDFITCHPTHQDNSKNKMEIAVINLMNNDTVAAENVLYNIINNDEDNIHARTKLADILISQQRFDEAKPIVDYLIINDPTNNYVIKLRIAVLRTSEDEVNILKKLIDNPSPHLNINLGYLYSRLAKLLRLSGNLSESETYCNKLLEINRFDYAAMNSLAIIYQKKGKLKDAENLLLEAIKIKPFNAYNYNELGQVYIQLYNINGDIEYKHKALSTFIRGLKIDCNNIPLRTEFARFLITHCDRAILGKKILEGNIKLDKSHLYSYTEISLLYQKVNKYEEARDILSHALLVNTKYTDVDLVPAYVVLGYSHLELKEYHESKKYFERSLRLKKENWSSYVGLAKSCLKLQHIQEYEQALDVILNKIDDIIYLSEFASWLKTNEKIDDALLIILKAEQLSGSTENYFINTIHAGIILEKIISIVGSKYIDGPYVDILQILSLVNTCTKICNATLVQDEHHEPSLHILYRLNFFLKKHVKDNHYLKTNYKNKYKTYLSRLFSANPKSTYGIDGIISHLKNAKRYRLSIAVIRTYGNMEKKPAQYFNQLYILFNLLANNVELSKIIQMALKKAITLPQVNLDNEIELITQDNIGILLNGIITFQNKDIPLLKYGDRSRNVNQSAEKLSNKSKKGVKVFFGLYKVKGLIIANCIEPYFEKIAKNESVIKKALLE